MGEGAHRAGAMPYGGGGSLPPASGRAHIRIHQLYRELARVAAPRLPALVDEELFVVEDEAVDTPRVAQRLGHPRVQRQRVAAEERYHQVQVAYDILTEPATRQAYDQARLKVEAQYEAGVVVADDEATKPPPSCMDVLVSLEELFSGGRKVVRFNRKLF